MKGAIFDVDGTLLDSMNVWYDTTAAFYRRHGIELTDEGFQYFKTVTLNESFPYIKKKYNITESFEELFSEFEGILSNEYKYNIPLKPYAFEYLHVLKKSGVKLGIATSTRASFCESALKRTGVFELFDAFAYSDEVNVNKSNPDIYLLAASRMGLEPFECMVFEDLLVGLKSSSRAGFKTCAVYDESNSDETELLKEHSTIYIKSFKELL